VCGVEKARNFQKSTLLLGFLEFQKEKEKKRKNMKRRCVCARKYTVIEKPPMKKIVPRVSHPITGQP
jgi:hypothetical protein